MRLRWIVLVGIVVASVIALMVISSVRTITHHYDRDPASHNLGNAWLEEKLRTSDFECRVRGFCYYDNDVNLSIFRGIPSPEVMKAWNLDSPIRAGQWREGYNADAETLVRIAPCSRGDNLIMMMADAPRAYAQQRFGGIAEEWAKHLQPCVAQGK